MGARSDPPPHGIGLLSGFFYHFPAPFTLSVGALRGGSLDKNFLRGRVRLTIFGPEGAVLEKFGKGLI